MTTTAKTSVRAIHGCSIATAMAKQHHAHDARHAQYGLHRKPQQARAAELPAPQEVDEERDHMADRQCGDGPAQVGAHRGERSLRLQVRHLVCVLQQYRNDHDGQTKQHADDGEANEIGDRHHEHQREAASSLLELVQAVDALGEERNQQHLGNVQQADDGGFAEVDHEYDGVPVLLQQGIQREADVGTEHQPTGEGTGPISSSSRHPQMVAWAPGPGM